MTSMPIVSLVDLLRLRAETLGERQAYAFLKDGEEIEGRLTYGELDHAARAIGRMICAIARPGDAVILAHPAGLEFIVAFFACQYASVVAVPVGAAHPRRDNERLAAIVADCGARLALTTADGISAFRAAAGQHHALARLEVHAIELWSDHGDVELNARAADGVPAFLQYTSGSTQRPRGVRVSHANILANLLAIHDAEGNSSVSRSLSWLPAYHDMGLIEGLLQPLYGGYPAWLMPHAAFVQRPARWLRAISRHGITVSGGPNFAYELCIRRVRDEELIDVDLRTWAVAYCGAEPVKAATLHAFADRFAGCGFDRAALRPVYGLAEATLLVAASRASAQEIKVLNACKASLDQGRFMPVAAGTPDSVPLVACGRPNAGTHVAVVDPERGSTLACGTIGEIWVSGPAVADGYHRAEASAPSPFVTQNIDGTTRRWLRTGDLGFLADGELVISGRMKDLIIVRGRKIHPHDLEQTAERCDARLAPNSAAAFAAQAPGAEQVVLCVEVPRSLARVQTDAAASLDALADRIRSRIYRNHAVAVATVAFVRLGALARTTSGKLMRFRCRRDFCAGSLAIVQRFDTPSLRAQPY